MSQPYPPLQDAVENLRVQSAALRADLSQLLRVEAPDFYAAVHAVIEAGGTTHVDPPSLTSDERQPETVPSAGLYDAALDEAPPRHLKDVWDGAGDVNDPLVPQDEYEHALVLSRLRNDPEAQWHGGSVPTKMGLDADTGTV